MEPFALLDDAPAGRLERLDGLIRVDRVGLDTLDAVLEAGWAQGWRALAWLPYEWDAVDGAIYWFARATVLDAFPASGPGLLSRLEPDITPARHEAAIDVLHEAIASGDSYQVNYTFRLGGRLEGDPVGLYRRLRLRQPTRFGLLAHLPGPADAWTLSLSPELFLEVDGDLVTARPMKGTATADLPPTALSDDPKNRAENLMIVDLLRNDLSRVAEQVEVVDLFGVERVGDLWQMSTTVRGRLHPGVGPADLLRATFPCGSITGAPKLSSMGLIRRVETTPRGIYTGALGVIEPGRMLLSVAIRTLTIDGGGTARLGVGSGVVADSVAASEWDESLAKAGFVAAPDLKEAIRVIDGVAPLEALHEARLAAGAAELGYPRPVGRVASAVRQTPPGAWRLGLTLAPDGTGSVTRSPLPRGAAVTVLLAQRPWRTGPLTHLKTSERGPLDEAWQEAEKVGAFDTIGFDEQGNVLEGGRSNVFALVDGRWVTPGAGMLPGVQRAAVLADPTLLGAEHIEVSALSVDELRRAERIVVTNAVRGILDARLEESS